MKQEPTKKFHSQLSSHWLKASTATKITSFVLIVLALASFVQVVYISQVRVEILKCQTGFIDDVVKTIEIRSKASTEASNAIEDLIRATQNEDLTRDEMREMRDHYLDEREQYKKKIAENPYPKIEIADRCYVR